MNGFNDSDVGAAIHSLIMNFLSGNVHTSMPGKVVKYDAVKKTVDVKPMLKKANPDGTQIEYPVLPDVPLLFGDASALSITAAVGDVVLLVFSEAGLEKWNPTKIPANTTLNRKFSLSDGFAVPGVYSTGTNVLKALIDERIQAAFNNHVHTVVSLGAPTSAPMTSAAFPVLPLVLGNGIGQTPVTTTKVKAV
jgi:hypothetical protein